MRYYIDARHSRVELHVIEDDPYCYSMSENYLFLYRHYEPDYEALTPIGKKEGEALVTMVREVIQKSKKMLSLPTTRKKPQVHDSYLSSDRLCHMYEECHSVVLTIDDKLIYNTDVFFDSNKEREVFEEDVYGKIMKMINILYTTLRTVAENAKKC